MGDTTVLSGVLLMRIDEWIYCFMVEWVSFRISNFVFHFFFNPVIQ